MLAYDSYVLADFFRFISQLYKLCEASQRFLLLKNLTDPAHFQPLMQ